MKFLIPVLVFVSVAQAALATSVYVGPYVSVESVRKAGGKTEKTVCYFTPAFVTVQRPSGVKVTLPLSLDSKELAKSIVAASQQSYVKKAVHVVAANPSVLISAGLLAEKVKPFPLFADSGAIYQREGKDAIELIQEAHEVCGRVGNAR